MARCCWYSRCSTNRTTAAATPTISAAPAARIGHLAASRATPTPPTRLLLAAITLAPVNSIPPAGPAAHRGHRGREPLLLGGWAKELVGLGHQAAVVAADPLHLPQQHQVLQGVAHQGGEGELTQEEHCRQHRSHERVQVGGQGADERLLACLVLLADTPMAWRAAGG